MITTVVKAGGLLGSPEHIVSRVLFIHRSLYRGRPLVRLVGRFHFLPPSSDDPERLMNFCRSAFILRYPDGKASTVSSFFFPSLSLSLFLSLLGKGVEPPVPLSRLASSVASNPCLVCFIKCSSQES